MRNGRTVLLSYRPTVLLFPVPQLLQNHPQRVDLLAVRRPVAGALRRDGPVVVLGRLADTLEARKRADPRTSYVAKLYQKGLDAILKKVAEEAAETIMAAKDGERDKVIYETADLWFHTLVLLAQQGIRPDEVLDELARREGMSGLVEKASRKDET